MIIRYATLDDRDMLLELLFDLFSVEKDFVFDREKHSRGLELLLRDAARAAVFVAESDKRIIGMVTGQIVVSTAAGGRSLLVEDLVVAKMFRRGGTGEALMRRVRAWGLETGVLRIQLVADMTNAPALRFYEKQRFARSRMIGYYKYE